MKKLYDRLENVDPILMDLGYVRSEDDMTLSSTGWLWRFFGTGAQLVAPAQQDRKPPMKIAVERLPDYYWRDLGFPPPMRDEDR